jgi:hypothetical protein
LATKGQTPDRSEGPNDKGAARGAADQIGAILSKGLDLAEASLSLGLTVVNRVGVAAQQQIFDRLTGQGVPSPAGGPSPESAPPPGAEHVGSAPPGSYEAPPSSGSEPEEPVYCITNRKPVAPGGPVVVSFSINNDGLTEPKRVRVRIEGFTGDVEGAHLDAGGFTVNPTRKTIAPMDFEKFVLRGPVPPETPADVYSGWIVVSSGGDFRIPVRLVVAP